MRTPRPIRHGSVGILLMLCGATFSPTSSALDLLESYRRALENDPAYAAAQHALEAARERLPQARAGLLPTLSANGNYGHADNQVRFGKGKEDGRNVESYGWNIQLVQPLVRVQNWAAYGQAGEQVAQAEADFQQAQQELILRVSKVYFDVLLAQEGIEVARAQEAALKQQLAQAERGFKVGLVPVTDVYEATSKLNLAVAQKLTASSALEAACAELERVIGPVDETLAVLGATAPLPLPQPEGIDDWIRGARDNYPLVRSRETMSRILKREVARNRAARLPTLDLTASYGTSYTSGTTTIVLDTDSSTKAAQVGLQMSLPLFVGGSLSSKVDEATANLARAEAELEAARREAATLARQAYAGVTNGVSQVDALDSALRSGRAAVEANAAGYRVGVRTNTDVLMAEQQYHVALRDHAKARYETLLQGLHLKAAVGSLHETDVVRLNELLEDGVPGGGSQPEAASGSVLRAERQPRRPLKLSENMR